MTARAAAAVTALLLFAAALCVRLVSWLAAADRGEPWATGFQGDAPLWQQLLQQRAAGEMPLELALPVRPPGMPFLVELVTAGGAAGVWWQRFAWLAIGAAVAPLVWLLARQELPRRVALFAGAFCALATNLVWLGSGAHAESPYLVLLLAGMLPLRALLRPGVPLGTWLAFGAWHGALCLLRVEHALVLLLLLAVLWRHGAAPRRLLVAAVAAALAVLPWQLHAMAAVRAFGSERGELPRGELPWDDTARAAVAAMPAPAQLPALLFVDATVRFRGGRRVTAADVDGVLREAYGAPPPPLPVPVVALYGGLNCFLGNSPEAAGGFSRQALDRPPPLCAAPGRFPPDWVANLPRGTFSFGYPPHLQALAHGYALAFADVAADPAGALARCARKLVHVWQGAATGLGSLGAPMGLSGVRRSVDVVTPDGALATAWRLLLLALTVAGVVLLRRAFVLHALLAVAAAKLATALVFFGYARQGALLVPLVGLALAAVADRATARVGAGWRRRLVAVAIALAALGELAFVLRAPAPTVDGVPFDALPPAARDDVRTRGVDYAARGGR